MFVDSQAQLREAWIARQGAEEALQYVLNQTREACQQLQSGLLSDSHITNVETPEAAAVEAANCSKQASARAVIDLTASSGEHCASDSDIMVAL